MVIFSAVWHWTDGAQFFFFLFFLRTAAVGNQDDEKEPKHWSPKLQALMHYFKLFMLIQSIDNMKLMKSAAFKCHLW